MLHGRQALHLDHLDLDHLDLDHLDLDHLDLDHLDLDHLGVSLHPIVRVIDDWNTNRSLALLAEVRVGRGRLMLCGFDLESDLDRRPVAR